MSLAGMERQFYKTEPIEQYRNHPLCDIHKTKLISFPFLSFVINLVSQQTIDAHRTFANLSGDKRHILLAVQFDRDVTICCSDNSLYNYDTLQVLEAF